MGKKHHERTPIVGPACRAALIALLSGGVIGWPAASASAQPVAEAQPAAIPEIPEFTVSSFSISYDRETPGLPSIESLVAESTVAVVQTGEGYVSASDPDARITIAALNQSLAASPARFSRKALDAVNRAIVRTLNAKGYIGVLVATSPDDLSIDIQDPNSDLAAPVNLWTDLRPGGSGPLHILIYTARVVQVRTVASGDHVPADRGVNHPVHARIRENSPIQPAAEGVEPGSDILRRDVIDDYTFRLNRHPGRRVDVAVSTAEQPGDVTLDYLVRENKPWF
ncbi:MAG: hypothetical protein JNK58_10175, partial [Phycisphaerae bacterium]|nr:hypothetical protein [Phycisphaerae bacterium]